MDLVLNILLADILVHQLAFIVRIPLVACRILLGTCQINLRYIFAGIRGHVFRPTVTQFIWRLVRISYKLLVRLCLVITVYYVVD